VKPSPARPANEGRAGLSIADLGKRENPLARHYSRFRVAERLLLTGHSHQAWPDCGFEAQAEAWNDAAEHVDEKWERAAAKAEDVRRGFARLLGDRNGVIALGASTHDLVIRLLSALPLAARPRLVTTNGEFHTVRRQLDRLAEERWIEVVKVSAEPAAAIAERLAAAVDRRTAAVLVSSVLFGNAHIVPGLGAVCAACRRAGAELLVDVYHHLDVVPFSLEREGLEDAFIVGGGYKYCQLGEGNGFLRVPPGRESMRPVVTGWFGEFESLARRSGGAVPYGTGAARWAGATYDPVSHYRGAAVFEFFVRERLTPERLHEVSRHQIALLGDGFDALDLDPGVIRRERTVPPEQIGGFLALTSARAGEISDRLRARGVATDFRGDQLRLGPAPYLSDAQLRAAVAALGEAVRAM
jgi:kynureninase